MPAQNAVTLNRYFLKRMVKMSGDDGMSKLGDDAAAKASQIPKPVTKFHGKG